MENLFSAQEAFWQPNLKDAELTYIPQFLSPQEADKLYAHLYENIPWRQDPITVFGKTYPQPRLTSLHALNDLPYSYSGIQMHPHPYTPELSELQKKIGQHTPAPFTTVLLNLYRDGKDSNGWHADNEKELGKNPVIASVSLGEKRFFHCKHRQDKNAKFKLELTHGSLLIMGGAMQHHWLHHIPKTARKIGPRINLTFRNIVC